jgi:hypothetical protein
MKKAFVAAKDPIGAALGRLLRYALQTEPVATASEAQVVMTCTDEETLDALENYHSVPVWQVVFMGQGVVHRRVRQFDGLELMVPLAAALKEE